MNRLLKTSLALILLLSANLLSYAATETLTLDMKSAPDFSGTALKDVKYTANFAKGKYDSKKGLYLAGNADYIEFDLSVLNGVVIKSATFTVSRADGLKLTTVAGGEAVVVSGTSITQDFNEGTTYLKIQRAVSSGTYVTPIVLTVETGVILPPSVSISSNSSQTTSLGKSIDPITATASRSASFSVSGLPEGLSGTTSDDGLTFTISGTPTATGNNTYSVTATADGKTSTAVGGTISVINGPVLSISNATQSCVQNKAIKNIVVSSNDESTVFSVSGLPEGVSGSGSGTTLTISGSSKEYGTFNFTVTGTLFGHSQTVNGVLTVTKDAPVLSSSSNVEQTVQLGKPMSVMTFTSDDEVSYSVSCLPAGIVAISDVDNKTLTISGKPTAIENIDFYVYGVSLDDGQHSNSISCSISITESEVAPAPVLTASASSITADKNSAITSLTISSDIKATWSINKPLPAGLSGASSPDGLSYVISGTPTAVAAASDYVITATANSTSSSLTVNIAVNAVAPVISASANAAQSIALGATADAITFSSSDADATFSVSGLPAGLTYVQSGSVFTISGTPTEAGSFEYSVTATVDGKSSVSKHTITVTAVDPTVTLSASKASAFSGDKVTLTATPAAKNVGATITKVVISEGDNVLATLTSAPYTYEYTAVAGTHKFTATATDSYGYTASANTTVAVQDATAPNVTLTADKTDINIGETAVLTAEASLTNGSAITKTVINNGASDVASSASASATYTFKPASTGTFTFSASATDDNDMAGNSTAVTINVTAVDPTVTLAASKASAFSGDKVTLTATPAAKNVGATIAKVVISEGENILATLTDAPYTYEYTAVAGTHTFTATATDSYGFTASANTTVNVQDATAPNVTLTADRSSLTLEPGSKATLTATAEATTGGAFITAVEIYDADNSLLATLNSAPYIYEFTPNAVGDYSFYAKAIDSNSLSTVSEAVSVSVANATAVNESNTSNAEWRQTADAVMLLNVEVKEMWLFSASGSLISNVSASNTIPTYLIPKGERFVVVAKIAGRTRPISNKFIK